MSFSKASLEAVGSQENDVLICKYCFCFAHDDSKCVLNKNKTERNLQRCLNSKCNVISHLNSKHSLIGKAKTCCDFTNIFLKDYFNFKRYNKNNSLMLWNNSINF